MNSFAKVFTVSCLIFCMPSGNLHAAPCIELNTQYNRAQLIADLPILPEPVRQAFETYERLRGDPVIQSFLPEEFVYKLMDAPEGEFMVHRLKGILERFQGDTRAEPTTVKLTGAFRGELIDKVPFNQIEERISHLGTATAAQFERSLGFLNVSDVHLLLSGGDYRNLTPDSLIAKYLAETGAQTLWRSFGTTVDAVNRQVIATGPQGPQRFVIALSHQSLPAYHRIFGHIPNLMSHLHSPGQGTLQVGFMGRAGAYSTTSRNADLIRHSINALWPQIVLTTTEAGRTRLYFDIAARGGVSFVKTPWILNGFCAKGGYTSCAHWWGEMGIGDVRTTEWVFPGKIDEHASNSIFPGDPVADARPRRQALSRFDIPAENPPAIVRMIRRLMTVPEAGQQLAVMIGTEAQLLNGEWANPGYVGVALTGHASIERVPFMFLNVNDHTRPIDPNFDPKMKPL